MFSLDINRPLIIFGEIYEAEKFVYQNPEVLQNLSACIFDDTVNEYFHGVKILDINSKVAREKLATICIAVTTACSNGYLEKKTFLESLGRNEFEDFFWAKALNKSIVVINANCHGKALAEYLDQSRHFRNSYLIYPLQQIQENVTGDISENVLKVTDIYTSRYKRS